MKFCPKLFTITLIIMQDFSTVYAMFCYCMVFKFHFTWWMIIIPVNIYICYVQVETFSKLHLVDRACSSCNLYKQFVQVATRTQMAVQVISGSEFYHQINPTIKINIIYNINMFNFYMKN